MPHRANGLPTEADQGDALRRFKADLFQVLAHPTRIHIIECLRDGEASVSTLLERTGVEPANLSQHLALLKARQLVARGKAGNQVVYRLGDPVLVELLESVRRYFHAHLAEAMAQLRSMEEANR